MPRNAGSEFKRLVILIVIFWTIVVIYVSAGMIWFEKSQGTRIFWLGLMGLVSLSMARLLWTTFRFGKPPTVAAVPPPDSGGNFSQAKKMGTFEKGLIWMMSASWTVFGGMAFVVILCFEPNRIRKGFWLLVIGIVTAFMAQSLQKTFRVKKDQEKGWK